METRGTTLITMIVRCGLVRCRYGWIDTDWNQSVKEKYPDWDTRLDVPRGNRRMCHKKRKMEEKEVRYSQDTILIRLTTFTANHAFKRSLQFRPSVLTLNSSELWSQATPADSVVCKSHQMIMMMIKMHPVMDLLVGALVWCQIDWRSWLLLFFKRFGILSREFFS